MLRFPERWGTSPGAARCRVGRRRHLVAPLATSRFSTAPQRPVLRSLRDGPFCVSEEERGRAASCTLTTAEGEGHASPVPRDDV